MAIPLENILEAWGDQSQIIWHEFKLSIYPSIYIQALWILGWPQIVLLVFVPQLYGRYWISYGKNFQNGILGNFWALPAAWEISFQSIVWDTGVVSTFTSMALTINQGVGKKLLHAFRVSSSQSQKCTPQCPFTGSGQPIQGFNPHKIPLCHATNKKYSIYKSYGCNILDIETEYGTL